MIELKDYKTPEEKWELITSGVIGGLPDLGVPEVQDDIIKDKNYHIFSSDTSKNWSIVKFHKNWCHLEYIWNDGTKGFVPQLIQFLSSKFPSKTKVISLCPLELEDDENFFGRDGNKLVDYYLSLGFKWDCDLTEQEKKYIDKNIIDSDDLGYMVMIKQEELNKFDKLKENKFFNDLDVQPVYIQIVDEEVDEIESGVDDDGEGSRVGWVEATGSVTFEITWEYIPNGKEFKERWVADCKGTPEGYSYEPESSWGYYGATPASESYDYIDWYKIYSLEFDYYVVAPSGEEFDYCEDHIEDIENCVEILANACLQKGGKPIDFKSLKESKMTEGNRLYNYRIVLTQPEGSRYHLTNADKLRFKTEEEAKTKLDSMMASMGDRLASKGLGLEIQSIEDKPRKPRQKASDDPDFKNPFKEGDILYANVGYSAGMPEWYKVIKTTPSTIVAKQLDDRIVSDDGFGQNGTKMPVVDRFMTRWGKEEPEVRMSVKKSDYEYYAWYDRHLFQLWDGKPKDFYTD